MTADRIQLKAAYTHARALADVALREAQAAAADSIAAHGRPTWAKAWKRAEVRLEDYYRAVDRREAARRALAAAEAAARPTGSAAGDAA